jgi:pyruvate formate lyase activating enzyme
MKSRRKLFTGVKILMNEAKFYEKITKNSISCWLCNHYCQISDGKTGSCGVRKNIKGKLYSLVYGYPVALNIDPIEKKPFFHFYPGSLAYSIGTYGCNLSCANCQNWDMSQAIGIENKIKNFEFISPEKIVEEALGNNCISIAYTYNEPTVFTEYALDIMKLAYHNGLKNVWVSNGYMSEECLDKIIPYLDAINVDLKSADNNFYKNNCAAKLEPILKNLIKIKREQIHLEITTLIIPSLSDEIDMLAKIAEFIAEELDIETPWHLTKFSPKISWKLKNIPPTGDDFIYEAYELGKEAGLKYVYVGNIPGDQKENTFCPKCGELVIHRLGYNIERNDISGRCPNCDHSLDIIL